MAGLLGDIFSAGDAAKRKLRDLLGNPVLAAQQFAGNINDRARNLNEMTSAAAREGMDYGPATQRLAGLMADAYNPVGVTVLRKNSSKLEPWQITPSQWRQANFNEEINRYLPEDYFDDVKLSSKISDFPKNVGKVKNFDLRQDEIGGFALFDKGKQIGYADNAAVIVSPEYQGQGLGVEIVKELRKSNPEYTFGNQTPAGTNLMYSFHKAEVKKALEEGKKVPDEVLEFYPEFRKKSLLD